MEFLKDKNDLIVFLPDRVESANAAEVEKQIREIREDNVGGKLIIDAADTKYISSAGLRVLLSLRKSEGWLDVINVCEEVYGVFEMTGFNKLLNVKKVMREVSSDGCELIANGGCGSIYRLDSDTLLKTYVVNMSLEDVMHERDNSQKAFLYGIPTAISYDVVKSGGGYGIVFELLNAETIGSVITENPDKISEYMKKYSELLKHIHSTHVKEKEFAPAGDRYKRLVAELEKDKSLSPEKINKLKILFNSIPDRDTLVHGDFHTKNVMLQNGELILIDIGDIGRGNPIYDLAEMYMCFNLLSDMSLRYALGFDPSLRDEVWNEIMRNYFNTDDKNKIDELNKTIRFYAVGFSLCLLMTSKRAPAQIKNECYDRAAKEFFPFVDDSLKQLAIF